MGQSCASCHCEVNCCGPGDEGEEGTTINTEPPPKAGSRRRSRSSPSVFDEMEGTVEIEMDGRKVVTASDIAGVFERYKTEIGRLSEMVNEQQKMIEEHQRQSVETRGKYRRTHLTEATGSLTASSSASSSPLAGSSSDESDEHDPSSTLQKPSMLNDNSNSDMTPVPSEMCSPVRSAVDELLEEPSSVARTLSMSVTPPDSDRPLPMDVRVMPVATRADRASIKLLSIASDADTDRESNPDSSDHISLMKSYPETDTDIRKRRRRTDSDGSELVFLGISKPRLDRSRSLDTTSSKRHQTPTKVDTRRSRDQMDQFSSMFDLMAVSATPEPPLSLTIDDSEKAEAIDLLRNDTIHLRFQVLGLHYGDMDDDEIELSRAVDNSDIETLKRKLHELSGGECDTPDLFDRGIKEAKVAMEYRCGGEGIFKGECPSLYDSNEKSVLSCGNDRCGYATFEIEVKLNMPELVKVMSGRSISPRMALERQSSMIMLDRPDSAGILASAPSSPKSMTRSRGSEEGTSPKQHHPRGLVESDLESLSSPKFGLLSPSQRLKRQSSVSTPGSSRFSFAGPLSDPIKPKKSSSSTPRGMTPRRSRSSEAQSAAFARHAQKKFRVVSKNCPGALLVKMHEMNVQTRRSFCRSSAMFEVDNMLQSASIEDGCKVSDELLITADLYGWLNGLRMKRINQGKVAPPKPLGKLYCVCQFSYN